VFTGKLTINGLFLILTDSESLLWLRPGHWHIAHHGYLDSVDWTLWAWDLGDWESVTLSASMFLGVLVIVGRLRGSDSLRVTNYHSLLFQSTLSASVLLGLLSCDYEPLSLFITIHRDLRVPRLSWLRSSALAVHADSMPVSWAELAQSCYTHATQVACDDADQFVTLY
jgi:hypothetical protein